MQKHRIFLWDNKLIFKYLHELRYTSVQENVTGLQAFEGRFNFNLLNAELNPIC